MVHGRGMWIRKDTTKIIIAIIIAFSLFVACLLHVLGSTYVDSSYQCLSTNVSIRIYYNLFVVVIPACYVMSMSVCSIKKTPFCRSNIIGVAGPPPDNVLANHRLSLFPTTSLLQNLPSLSTEQLRTTVTTSELRTTMAMAMLNIPITILMVIQCTFGVIGDYLKLGILQVIGVIFETFICLIEPLILIAESSTLRKRIKRYLCKNNGNMATNGESSFQIVSPNSQNIPRDDVTRESRNIPSFLQRKSDVHISVKVTKNDNYGNHQDHGTRLSMASSFSLEIESKDGNASVTALSDHTMPSAYQKRTDSLDSVYACAGNSVGQSRRCSIATEPNTPKVHDSGSNTHVYFLPAMLVTGNKDSEIPDFYLDMRHHDQQTKKIRRSTLPILNTISDSPSIKSSNGFMTLVSPNKICAPRVFFSQNGYFSNDSRHHASLAEDEKNTHLPGSCQNF